ncbi:putative phosphotransferase related to Ser/Thr protein kinase [Methanosarcina barkeri str. Wiesmoor]|uniref:Aminoglycoside phosphotransferase domain-containing protein n=2 Tax=Methanosarcina barkeri TaxID=2208 RepID=Q46AK8_METBF|nr:aminoglycoside phosphotransferase family protein [Methanosarcina barkeri]AKB51838.1 putative phosphotransferase related to Ser/Thr protein kinase [Methanosarcina barkeri str. Wiesmoor]
MTDIHKASLLATLGNMFANEINDAQYSTEVLQGGTVGDVAKLFGNAETDNGLLPFSIIVKTQRKWDRYGDPDSWRREYDIYKQGLNDELPKVLKLPRCYLLEESEGITQIWMEFIEGKTGNKKLHGNELALAAQKLGELQAEFHLYGERDLPYLRNYPAVRSSFNLWWNRMKSRLSRPIDGFPDELRHILNDYALHANNIFASFDTLPLTLCQGDFHHDNLIFRESAGETDIYLIDWDCAGYGYMGEDAVDVLMEAFVYSSRDISLLPYFKQKIIDGYCEGVRSRGIDFAMCNTLVRDIFALAWGFRIANLYLFYKDELPKKRCIEILQAMLTEENMNV